MNTNSSAIESPQITSRARLSRAERELSGELVATGSRVEYGRPEPGDIPELARICFEAFGQLHDHHRVPRDFPDLEMAKMLIGLFATRDDFFGVAAKVDGRLAGSNFLSVMDDVGGIGPITIDPSVQGRGVGRGLMQRVMEHADQRGMRGIRLVQEALNTTSLPLYASLGFDVRETLGSMKIAPAAMADGTVRRATRDDLPVLQELGRHYYGVSRVHELAAWMSVEMPVLLRERAGKARGYFMPGKLGHAAAETVEDTLALIGEAGRHAPSEVATFLCPLRNSGLHQGALRAGHRLEKVLTYMTRGPYEAPSGVWAPSYLY